MILHVITLLRRVTCCCKKNKTKNTLHRHFVHFARVCMRLCIVGEWEWGWWGGACSISRVMKWNETFAFVNL